MTIQDVFKKFGNIYLEKYNPNYLQLSVFNKIINCKTDKMGYHIYECNECHKRVYTYNSCRDRHCPNCGEYKRILWINNHKKDIIDVNYLHVVFTIPRELRKIFYYNQEVCYNILLKVSSDVIINSSKYQIGLVSMLHTWSQTANYHPHIHMILTDGGIYLNKWIDHINLDMDKIEKEFRYRLLKELKRDDLKFYGNISYLNNELSYYEYLDKLKDIRFICYKKSPFNNVDSVYEYLSKYVYRVCMTNDRIIDITNDRVTFKYKDTYNRDIDRTMSIKGEEYIRKYLLHVLPKNFMKIRYYGIYSNKFKRKKLKRAIIITKTKKIKEKLLSKREILNMINRRDIFKCKYCSGSLIHVKEVKKKKPPWIKQNKEVLKYT